MELDGSLIRGDKWGETKAKLATLKSSDFTILIKGIRNEVKRMKTENMVFEHFLQKNEPGLISGMEKTMQHLQSMQNRFVSGISVINTTKSNEKIDDSIDSNTPSLTEQKLKGPRINFSVKTDLALRDYDTIQVNLKEFKEHARKLKNKMRAEIEENRIRGAEINETKSNFEQQIVIGAVEELTQKIPAEKFVRYMQEWLKTSVIIMEKLRLRRKNLSTSLRKLKLLFAQKEELGETVTEADIEQLIISNKNFLEEIDLKNNCLHEIKHMSGKVNLTLTKHKYLLEEQETFTKSMESQLVQISKQMDYLNLNYYHTISELDVSQKKFDYLKNVIKTYKVPEVMEYIRKKSELAEYKKRMKVWRRKVNIQNIMLHTYCNAMCQLTGSEAVKNEWLTKKIFSVDDDYLPQDLNLIIKRGRFSMSNLSRSNSRFNSKLLMKK
ncbi:cilia- and flagella-associated protein 263-like [Onthophagus taurus]|uniref:cilia- and flagella-associated protein 263-like n=1 Tax=Onthophagus taurus TaxID=166361 RepID=UPI0039BE6D32